MHSSVLLQLRRAGIPTAYVLTESPYDPGRETDIAPCAQVVFTNERSCVDAFRAVQPHTYYLGAAYDPERHHPSEPDESVPAHDVVFVGVGFSERIALLGGVDWSGIDLGLYGGWSLLGSRSRLRQYVRGNIIPNEMAAKLYGRAKIGLNLYRTSIGIGHHVEHIQHAESLNPRAVELAACRVFQVSDYRAEVSDVFGSAAPTARTSAELEAIIRRALADEPYRAAMAERAYECVTPASFTSRARQMVATLERVADASGFRTISRDGVGADMVRR